MKYRGGWSIHKYPDEGTDNEDAFAVSTDKTLVALSDGASDSYDSATWSRMIVAKYLIEPRLSSEWVASLVEEYTKHVDRDALPWNAQGAFDRGSFATVLGVRIRNSQVLVEAIGDSIVVMADKRVGVVQSFPYTSPEQFRAFPTLISTQANSNKLLFGENSAYGQLILDFDELDQPALFVMSDALGEWTLSQGLTGIRSLLTVKTQRQFETLVMRERECGRLRLDDTTLVTFV